MSKELFWLTLTLIMTGVMWIPYVIDRGLVRGWWAVFDNPAPGAKPQSAWAQRLFFAHTNSLDNLTIFSALVLILAVIEHATQATAIACAAYFWSRLAYLVVYTLGVPVLRTLCFAVGFVAQAVLVLAVFGKM
ncbi:MAG: MAPEG family protein [Pseudorhodoplanes sp.]